jgi:hypothetical protein
VDCSRSSGGGSERFTNDGYDELENAAAAAAAVAASIVVMWSLLSLYSSPALNINDEDGATSQQPARPSYDLGAATRFIQEIQHGC